MCYDGSFHDTCENWCNGDRTEIWQLERCRNVCNWTYGGTLPLKRDSRRSERKVKQMCYWFTENWSTQSKKPSRWWIIEAGGSCKEFIMNLENSPITNATRLVVRSCLLLQRWSVVIIGGDCSIMIMQILSSNVDSLSNGSSATCNHCYQLL